MLRALLIRHAEHALQDRVLVGRSHGIGLTPHGGERAHALGRALITENVELLQSSPRARCLETARQIAESLRLSVETDDALDEIDFGAWTGMEFAALKDDSKWRAWNQLRALARPPGGESMAEAQRRIMHHLDNLDRRRIGGAVAIVTHAEIIRAALLQCRGLPLDAWASIEIAPASISRLDYPPAARSMEFNLRGAA